MAVKLADNEIATLQYNDTNRGGSIRDEQSTQVLGELANTRIFSTVSVFLVSARTAQLPV